MSLKILVVCSGNICRSPAAKAAIEEAAADFGINVEVDSAGTGAWNVGEEPHPQAVAAGARAGLQIEGRARRVIPADFERFDMILAMDRSNLKDLVDMTTSLGERAKLRLFRPYDPFSIEDEVPDPYGGTDADYDETIAIVKAAARGMMTTLDSVGVQDSVTLE